MMCDVCATIILVGKEWISTHATYDACFSTSCRRSFDYRRWYQRQQQQQQQSNSWICADSTIGWRKSNYFCFCLGSNIQCPNDLNCKNRSHNLMKNHPHKAIVFASRPLHCIALYCIGGNEELDCWNYTLLSCLLFISSIVSHTIYKIKIVLSFGPTFSMTRRFWSQL